MRALCKTIVLCLALGSFARADPGPPKEFPLQKGNYWIYKAKIKALIVKPDHTAEIKEETITFKMEVLDVSHAGYFAALVKGFPSDCIWGDLVKTRRLHVILDDDSLLILPDDNGGAWREVKSGELSYSLDEELYTIPPVRTSKSSPDRSWITADTGPFDPSGIKGVAGRKGLRLYLTHDPANDLTSPRISWVPGVGIVRYLYRPDSDRMDCDLRLIEFGHAEGPAQP